MAETTVRGRRTLATRARIADAALKLFLDHGYAETTINEIYRQLAALCDFAQPPAYEPAKQGEVRRNAQDITRIREELGWTPRYSLSQGLAQVVAAARADTQAAAVLG